MVHSFRSKTAGLQSRIWFGNDYSGSDLIRIYNFSLQAYVPLNPKDLVTVHITTVEICSRAPATILQTNEQTA
jgi:hypothetical protein